MSDYTKTVWVNAGTPAINDTNLNKIEDGIDTAHSELATHEALESSVHGAVSAATASKIMIRDASGRVKVAAPSATDDIAILSTVTDAVSTHNAIAASDTVAAHVELATAAEVTTGTDTTRAVTPAGAKVELDKKINHSLVTAANDFLVASGSGVVAKQTLAQAKVTLGILATVYGNAAYTDSITAGSPVTKSIALGASTYTRGMAVIKNTSYRTGIIVFFGTDNTKTVAAGSIKDPGSTSYLAGGAWARRHTGEVADGSIYGWGIFTEGGCAGHPDAIIKECYINGSNLQIEFDMTSGTNSLAATVDWQVW